MIAAPGFYDLPAKEYHADPCVIPSLSSSIAVDLIRRSPEHARLRHPRLCEQKRDEANDSMNLGSIIHELLLGKGGGFAIFEGDSWRGKEAGAFWDNAISAGRTPIKRAEFDLAQELCSHVKEKIVEYGIGHIFSEGESEKVAIWKEGEQYARAMFDRWIPSRNEIWDIKTTGTCAHPDELKRHIASMDYAMRSEFYLRGASQLTGIPAIKGGLGYCFLFVETEPPFSVVPAYLGETFREYGRRKAQQAVDTWRRCMETNTWPSYVSQIVEVDAPAYIAYQLEDEDGQINIGGKVL